MVTVRDCDGHWCLVNPLAFEYKGHSYAVPVDFKTNFANFLPQGRWDIPAIKHDWLYSLAVNWFFALVPCQCHGGKQKIWKWEIDSIFDGDLKAHKVSWVERTFFVGMVRSFGTFYFALGRKRDGKEMQSKAIGGARKRP